MNKSNKVGNLAMERVPATRTTFQAKLPKSTVNGDSSQSNNSSSFTVNWVLTRKLQPWQKAAYTWHILWSTISTLTKPYSHTHINQWTRKTFTERWITTYYRRKWKIGKTSKQMTENALHICLQSFWHTLKCCTIKCKIWTSWGTVCPSSTMIFLVQWVSIWCPSSILAGTAGVRMAIACLTIARASIAWALRRLWKTWNRREMLL